MESQQHNSKDENKLYLVKFNCINYFRSFEMIRRLYFILLISAMLVVGRSLSADEPDAPARQISTNDVSKTSATVTWLSGDDAHGAIVVVRTSEFNLSNSSHLPANGTSYTAADYSATTSGGSVSYTDPDCDNIDAGKVIFNSYQGSTGTVSYPDDDGAFTLIVNNLTAGEKYYVAVFEMDDNDADPNPDAPDYKDPATSTIQNPNEMYMMPPDVTHYHATQLTDQRFFANWEDITTTQCEECAKYRITLTEEGKAPSSFDIDFADIGESYEYVAGIDENICYSYTIRAVHESQVVPLEDSPFQPVTTLPVPNDYTVVDFNTAQTYDIDAIDPDDVNNNSMIWYKPRNGEDYEDVVNSGKTDHTKFPAIANEIYACDAAVYHEFYAGNVRVCGDYDPDHKFRTYEWGITGGSTTYFRRLPSDLANNVPSDNDAIAVQWSDAVGGTFEIWANFTDSYYEDEIGNTGRISREIYVIGAPTWTTQPQNKTACTGDTDVPFMAKANDGGQITSPYYQWQCSTDDGATWQDLTNSGNPYAGETTSKLLITDVTTGLSGNWYRAKVTRDNPCYGPYTSGSATLSQVYNSPNFVVEPVDYAVCENNGASFTASFTADVSGTDLSFQWWTDPVMTGFDWSEITDGSTFTDVTFAGATTKTLMVTVGENAANNIEGWDFSLQAYNDFCDADFSATVNITYNVPPTVSIDFVGDGEICEGETEEIEATELLGGGPFTYVFYYLESGSNAIQNQPATAGTWAGFTTSKLTITGHYSQSPTRYQLDVINACGTASSNVITLTIGTPPSFDTPPWPQNPEVCEYDDVYFYGTVTETAPTTYIWERSTNDGEDWHSLLDGGTGGGLGNEFYYGITTTRLWVTYPPRDIDGYMFRLYAENTCGYDYSDAVTMDVIYTPEFTLQPEDADVCETTIGETPAHTVSFTATSVGSNVISHTWQFSIDDGATYYYLPSTTLQTSGIADYDGVNTSELTITGRYPYNDILFRLASANTCGTGTSDPARLTVHSNPSFSDTDEISITSSGGEIEEDHNWACEGGWFEVFGNLSSGVLGADQFEFQWQMLDLNTSTDWNAASTEVEDGGYFSGATTSNLVISNVTVDIDNRAFRVYVTSPYCGPAYGTSEAVTITVYTRPEITQHPEHQCICPDACATFTSTASSNADISFRWQMNATPEDDGTWSFINNGATFSGATTTELEVCAPGSVYEGYGFRMLASNSCEDNVTSDYATLCVYDDPDITSVWDLDTRACYGDDVTLNATILGDNISYSWQYSTDNGSSWSAVPNSESTLIANPAQLMLNSVTDAMDGYYYKVHGYNTCGNDDAATEFTQIITLTVYPEFVAEQHPQTETTCPEGTAEFMGSFTTMTAEYNDCNVSHTWEYKYYTDGSYMTVPSGSVDPDGDGIATVFSGVNTTKLTVSGDLEDFDYYAFRLKGETDCACGTEYTNNGLLLSVGLGLEYCIPYDQEVFLCENDNDMAEMCGSVSGTGPITYQWQYNTSEDPYNWNAAENWFDISTSPQLGADWVGYTERCLTIDNAPASLDGTKLRLVASNICGTLTFDDPMTIWVADDPEIVWSDPPHGADAFVCEDQWLDLQISTINSDEFAWIYTDDTGDPSVIDPSGSTTWTDVLPNNGWAVVPDNDDYDGVTTTTLSIKGNTAYNSYQYAMLFRGDDACNVHASDVYTVSVLPKTVFEYGDMTDLVCYSCTDSDNSCAAVFTASVTNENHPNMPSGYPVYDWMFTTNGGADWNDITGAGLTSGTHYTVIDGTRLQLAPHELTWNGYEFRLEANTAFCGTYTSDPMTLYIVDDPTADIETTAICETPIADVLDPCYVDGEYYIAATVTGGGCLTYEWQWDSAGGTSWADVYDDWAADNSDFFNGMVDSGDPSTVFTAPSGTIQFPDGDYDSPVTLQLWTTGLSADHPMLSSTPNFNLLFGNATECFDAPCATDNTTEQVTIDGIPDFDPQPSDAVGCVGFDATFNSSAGTGYNYMWQYSDTDPGTNCDWADITDMPWGIYSGHTTETLSINNAPSFISGYWFRLKAVGLSSGCPAYSDAASLVVLGAPSIVLSPEENRVCEGYNATFTAELDQDILDHGDNTFFWQVNEYVGGAYIGWDDLNSGYSDFDSYAGTSTSKLIIDGNGAGVHRSMDSYKYRFCLENQCGFTCFTTEEEGLLVVQTVPSIDCDEQACVQQNVTEVELLCGEITELNAYVADGLNMDAGTTVQWYVVDQSLSGMDYCTAGTFIEDVAFDHGYAYTNDRVWDSGMNSYRYTLQITASGTTEYSVYASVTNDCGDAEFAGNCRTAILPIPSNLSCTATACEVTEDDIHETCGDVVTMMHSATVSEDADHENYGFTWWRDLANDGNYCETGGAIINTDGEPYSGSAGTVTHTYNNLGDGLVEFVSTLVVAPELGSTYSYYAQYEDDCGFTYTDEDNCRTVVQPIVAPSFSYLDSRLDHLAVCAEQDAEWTVYLIDPESWGKKTYQWWYKAPTSGADWERLESGDIPGMTGYYDPGTYDYENTLTLPAVDYDWHLYKFRAEVFGECEHPVPYTTTPPADDDYNARWTNASILTINPALSWIEYPESMTVCDNLNEYCFNAEVAGFNPPNQPITYRWYVNPADVNDGSGSLPPDCGDATRPSNPGDWYAIDSGEWGPYTGANANNHYSGYTTSQLCFDDVLNECNQPPCPTPLHGNQYMLYIEDACGDCSFSDVVTLNVYPQPEVNCVLPDQEVCENEFASIDALITNFSDFYAEDGGGNPLYDYRDHICFQWQVSSNTTNPNWNEWTDITPDPTDIYWNNTTTDTEVRSTLYVKGDLARDDWHYRAFVYDCACWTEESDYDNPSIRYYSDNEVAVSVIEGLSVTSDEDNYQSRSYCWNRYIDGYPYYTGIIQFSETVTGPEVKEYKWQYYDPCEPTGWYDLASSVNNVSFDGITTTRLTIDGNNHSSDPDKGLIAFDNAQFRLMVKTDACENTWHAVDDLLSEPSPGFTRTHTITVKNRPLFRGAWTGNTGQPQSPDDTNSDPEWTTAEICAGENTSFAATVSFEDRPTDYIWEFSSNNGSTWHEVTEGGEFPRWQTSYPEPVLCPIYCDDIWETQPKLWLYNVPATFSDDYEFRVKAVTFNDDTEETTCGTVYSNEAELIVHDAVAVTAFELEETVCAGNNVTVTFDSEITGTQSNMTYKWEYSDNGTNWYNLTQLLIDTDPENSDMQTASGSWYGSLYVANVSLELYEPPFAYDGYQFRLTSGYGADVDDNCGNNVDVATLRLHQSPVWEEEPEDMRVCEGDWGMFLATVTNTDVYSYRWQYSNYDYGSGMWGDWYFLTGNANSSNDYDASDWSVCDPDTDICHDFGKYTSRLWIRSNSELDDEYDSYRYRAVTTNECVLNYQSGSAQIDNILGITFGLEDTGICIPNELEDGSTTVNIYGRSPSTGVTYKWTWSNDGSTWYDDYYDQDWYNGSSAYSLNLTNIRQNDGVLLKVTAGYDENGDQVECDEVERTYEINYNVTPTVTIQVGEVKAPNNGSTDDPIHENTSCTILGSQQTFPTTVPQVVVVGNHPGYMGTVTVDGLTNGATCLPDPEAGNVKTVQCVNSAVKYIAKIDETTLENGYTIEWYYDGGTSGFGKIPDDLPVGTGTEGHFSGWTTTELWVTAYGCCEWDYYAKVINECDATESNVAEMILKQLWTVDIDLTASMCTDVENIYTVEEENIDGDGPFEYQWQHIPLEEGESWTASDWEDLENNDTFSGVTTSALTVMGNDGFHHDIFRVQVGNFCGTEWSNAMSITEILYTPTFTITEEQTVCEEESAEFTTDFTCVGCGYGDEDPGDLSYVWYGSDVNDDDFFTPGNVLSASSIYLGVDTYELTVNVPNTDDNDLDGMYYGVKVEGATGCKYKLSNVGQLFVNQYPRTQLVSGQETSILICEFSDPIVVSAEVLNDTDAPSWTGEWQISFDGSSFEDISTFIGSNPSYANKFADYDTEDLTIQNITQQSLNGTYYKFVASNSCGETETGMVSLMVETTPEFIADPARALGCEDEASEFAATVSGGTTAEYEWWYYDGDEGEPDAGTTWYEVSDLADPAFTGVETTRLTIDPVNAYNGYYFRISATNFCTDDPIFSDWAQLINSDAPPSITSQPAVDGTICEGEAASITVGHTDGLLFYWSYSENSTGPWTDIDWDPDNDDPDFSGENSETLVINTPEDYEDMYFRVILRNGCDYSEYSDPVQLAPVNYVPDVSLGTNPTEVCVGDDVDLTATTDDNGVLYSWWFTQDTPGDPIDISTWDLVETGTTTPTIDTDGWNYGEWYYVFGAKSNADCELALTDYAVLTVGSVSVDGITATGGELADDTYTICNTGSGYELTVDYFAYPTTVPTWMHSTNDGTTWNAVGYTETFLLPAGIAEGDQLFAHVDNGICEGYSETVTIDINYAPTVTLESDMTELCVGEGSVTLTATNAGDEAPFSWTVNGELVDGEDGSEYVFTPTEPGEYDIQVSATNDCGYDESDIITVTAGSISVDGITANEGDLNTYTYTYTICNTGSGYELTVDYFAYPTTMPTWMHSTNDGTTWNAVGYTETFLLPAGIAEGDQLFAHFDNGICEEFSETVTIDINYAPTITLESDVDEVCLGERGVAFTASNDGDEATFSWTVNGELVDGVDGNEYVMNPSEAGRYEVQVSATNDCGTDMSDVLTITVGQIVDISLDAGAGDFDSQYYTWDICYDDETWYGITADATSIPGDLTVAYSWYWYDSEEGMWYEADTEGSELPVEPNDGDRYYVEADNGICTENSATVTLDVDELPDVYMSYPDDRVLQVPPYFDGSTPVNYFGALLPASSKADESSIMYQWKYDDGTQGDDDVADWPDVTDEAGVYSGATTDMLYITGSLDIDGYRYALVATNDCGTGITMIGTLDYEGCLPVDITEQPVSATVELDDGDEATETFTVDVDGTPNYTYQWYYRDYDETSWTMLDGTTALTGLEFAGFTTSELEVDVTGGASNAWPYSGIQFQVVAGNECHEDSETSDAATLTILDEEPEQAENIQWVFMTAQMIVFTFDAGDGDRRLILAEERTFNQISDDVEDGWDIIDETDGEVTDEFDDGNIKTLPDNSDVKIIYDSEDEPSNVYARGLERDTRYSFKVIEYNTGANSRNYNYNNDDATGNPRARYTTPKIGTEDQELPNPGGSEYSISNIVPNPASDHFTLTMNLRSEQVVRMAMYDNEGKQVLSIIDGESYSKGSHTINVGLENVASGHYSILISAGNELIIEQIVVAK